MIGLMVELVASTLVHDTDVTHGTDPLCDSITGHRVTGGQARCEVLNEM